MTPLREDASETTRAAIDLYEPRAQRTYTPTRAVIARSSGVFHWTPEGRRLYDFTSGVLVANLGHNPVSWLRRVHQVLGWQELPNVDGAFLTSVPLTSYNAITEVEAEASRRLVEFLQQRPGGRRMQQVLWAASGSEAVQKGLWAALARDLERSIILATRHGFHGKKGLAGATTGCETDPERDPRVRFVSFPMRECSDVGQRGDTFDPLPYRRELDDLHRQHGQRLGCLITEPYLGGGGSYHPPAAYLHLLQSFCREHDLVFILDEIQSSFGRTGTAFAFEKYGLEPDLVVLGKGLANGAPGAAVVGRRDVLGKLGYGEGSDTYSGNAYCCAAVLATLEAFGSPTLLSHVADASPILERGLLRLKEFPFVKHVRGEEHGMVWGVETSEWGGLSATDLANCIVRACYEGDGGDGIHLLGPLAKKVIRVAPPLVITQEQARDAMDLFYRCLHHLTRDLREC